MNSREQLIELIRKEFIGPDLINREGFIQENGEEILIGDPPRIRYSAGILFPRNKSIELNQDVDFILEEVNNIEDEHNEVLSPQILSDNDDFQNVTDEILNLSSSYNQSSISLTVNLKSEDILEIEINTATYETKHEKDKNSKDIVKHYRKPKKALITIQSKELPNKNIRVKKIDVKQNDIFTGLEIFIVFRFVEFDSTTYTFSLVNTKNISDGSIKDEDCFFQSELVIKSLIGFNPLPSDKKIKINDEDYLTNKLLYRNTHNYAIGHGCASEWIYENEVVKQIKTSILPVYEVKPIVPSSLENIELDMYNLSRKAKFDSNISSLENLYIQYENWIRDLELKLSTLKDDYFETAQKHINNCRKCNQRIIDGIKLLRKDEKVRESFEMMNEAMLMQQLHYRLPLRKWEQIESKNDIAIQDILMPDIHNKTTWFDIENNVYGKWRPFQLAFILMNLDSINTEDTEESNLRDIVDLIWFPTGGGKTEAYLGLSAYTIFLRRIKNKDAFGTTVLMRYTLRLLTAQQYERASSLICACEIIRQRNINLLGDKRITIGLWVGGETTPNKMSQGENSAIKAFNDIYKGQRSDNPFVMLKCPWCGAQMGIVELKNNTRMLPGYHLTRKNGVQVFRYKCYNTKCDFSNEVNDLPLTVIDEDIYENPSTLLIGTVDKFAMLPFLPIAQRIFGICNGKRLNSPDLIIQDELHLISGPLGSTVGLYETMIGELSTFRANGIIRKPKIVASTATISRAKEQCNALFNCGHENVFQFPPSGIDAGDSFFAKEDKNAVGRKYIGIYATSSSSYSMTIIRLYAALLYSANAIEVNSLEESDAYFTNLGYFNSLRELGQTATWISADISEYLHTIYKRRYEDMDPEYKQKRRYIYRYEELTSRIPGDKVTESLQNLNIKCTNQLDGERPVDICLATNMISVGVDIPRLGLMTVVGQPKTTSEYIQATSRVGRSRNAHGAVFTVYNPARPRDRSHYEQFTFYHSKMYSYVEPSSVTPFSSPLRERALHAIVIGLIRLTQDEKNFDNTNIFNQEDLIERVKEIIEERTSNIDPEETISTMSDVDEILELWEARNPSKYQNFKNDEIEPLMYMSGTIPNIEWADRGFKTPTSMRNVDSSCEVAIINRSYSGKEEI